MEQSDATRRYELAIALQLQLRGWQVFELEAGAGADFVMHAGDVTYVVAIKSTSEARADRVIPALSQAILQAQAVAATLNARPLAIIHTRDAPPSLLTQVQQFANRYAPRTAVGVYSSSDRKLFVGKTLVAPVKSEMRSFRRPGSRSAVSSEQIDLFSDLNQWLLKVLLASHIPAHLLSAPRENFANAAHLASAAQVSHMSASRFVRQLHDRGYLDGDASYLRLVRKRDLLDRWKAIQARPYTDRPMTFAFPGAKVEELADVASAEGGCVALFAAAQALGLGHVRGAVPYLYVRGRSGTAQSALHNAVRAQPGQNPDFIIRRARYPQAVFRASVIQGNTRVSDVIQIWLDVSYHPSRGKEQADLIYEKVLRKVVEA